MKKEQIESMIDKKIEAKFSTGSLPSVVVSDLITMTNNINNMLIREKIDIKDYIGVEWDTIEKARVKYALHYIKHCNKRIYDMTWVKSKKGVLSINYWEIWKLLKFKEMITNSKEKVPVGRVFQKQIEKGIKLTESVIFSSEEKKWSSGDDKKVGEIHLRAFIKTGNVHEVVNLSENQFHLYEVDEEMCDKFGYDKLFIPYLKKKKSTK